MCPLSCGQVHTVDTAELLRAGFALQHETSQEALQPDSALHDATPPIQAEDAPVVVYLERLVETLERELAAAKTREAQLLEQQAELLALLRAHQEAQQRLLGEGRPRLGILSRLIASVRRPPPSGTGEPPAHREGSVW